MKLTPPLSAFERIALERNRQETEEGFDAAHDDMHGTDQLALAAACYALPSYHRTGEKPPVFWPWDAHWWKPTPRERQRELIKAAAMLVAEIERFDRCQGEMRSEGEGPAIEHKRAPVTETARVLIREMHKLISKNATFGDLGRWMDGHLEDARREARHEFREEAEANAATQAAFRFDLDQAKNQNKDQEKIIKKLRQEIATLLQNRPEPNPNGETIAPTQELTALATGQVLATDVEVGETTSGRLFFGLTGGNFIRLDRETAVRIRDRLTEITNRLLFFPSRR